MASITSVISFFILLLATYSYSAPIVNEYEITTPDLEFTTGTTMVEREDAVDMKLVTDDETTVVSHMDKDKKRSSTDGSSEESKTSVDVKLSSRKVEDSHSEEVTTPIDVKLATRKVEDSHSEELTTAIGVKLATRKVEDSHSEELTTPIDVKVSTRTVEEPTSPSDESNEKRSVEDEFMYTTMETSTDFNRRAIKPVESQEEVEKSTPLRTETEVKIIKDFEPSSSSDSFAKSTGLLRDESNEESKTPVPVKTEESIKTRSYIPKGKITPELYANIQKEKAWNRQHFASRNP